MTFDLNDTSVLITNNGGVPGTRQLLDVIFKTGLRHGTRFCSNILPDPTLGTRQTLTMCTVYLHKYMAYLVIEQ